MNFFTANWIALLPSAACLFVGLRTVQGMTDSREESWWTLAVRCIWLLFCCLGFLGFSARFTQTAILWVPVLLFLAIGLWRRNRLLKRICLVQTLTSTDSQEQQQQLALVFQQQNRASLRRWSRRLLRDLKAGKTIFAALARRRYARGWCQLINLRLADRFGADYRRNAAAENLPSLSLQRLDRQLQTSLWSLTSNFWALALIPAMFVIVVFICPTMAELGEEMEFNTPKLLLFLSWQMDYFADPLVILFLACSIPYCIISLFLMLIWLAPNSVYWQGMRWCLPSYRQAIAMVTLAHTATHHRDLGAACQSAAEILPDKFHQQRFRQAAQSIAAGHELSSVWKRLAINPAGYAALQTGSHDIPQELCRLAEDFATKGIHAVQRMATTIATTYCLLAATLVGCVAYVIIQMLYDLIVHMSQPIL